MKIHKQTKTQIGSRIPKGTADSVLFIDSNLKLAEDNTNFKWNDSGNILTIGSTVPTSDTHAANKKYVDDASTAPGGSDTQVQFNDAGSFGGDAGMTFNKTTDELTLGGNLTFGGTSQIDITAPKNFVFNATASGGLFFRSKFDIRFEANHPAPYNASVSFRGQSIKIYPADGSNTFVSIFQDNNDDFTIDNPHGFMTFQIGTGFKFLTLTDAAQHELIVNDGGVDIDFRIETDTEPNFFKIDATDNTLRIGDMDTNYMQVDVAGKILFTGASGLAYGEIYVNDNSTVTSVSNAGFTQFLHFAVNGHNQNTSPDHTNDHITITKAGVYMVDCCVNIKNDSGAAHDIEVVVSKNNNATIFPNMRRHRTLGTGTDVGAIPLCGHISLAVNDTLEVWITSDSASARDVIAEDVVLMVTQVGGN